MIGAVLLIRNSTKEKKDYNHITGRLTYLDKQMGNLPIRDIGEYRYVKIENYIYPFEIYADEQGARIDSLKTGDIVTAYFYENGFTRRDQLNRFLQYLEKDNKLYFKSGNAGVIAGYVVIAGSIFLIIFCYILYKRNKIAY
jgi:hypothetical protein